jgi:hypothetical protein
VKDIYAKDFQNSTGNQASFITSDIKFVETNDQCESAGKCRWEWVAGTGIQVSYFVLLLHVPMQH